MSQSNKPQPKPAGGSSSTANDDPEIETLEIDLRDPFLAGFLAWLIPGAGHIYQRRYGKGILFFVCIMGTFLYGLVALGDGHVVYASWTKADKRWQYPAQLAAGLVATPAIVQNRRVRSGKDPSTFLPEGFMVPPTETQLDEWQATLGARFELGTTYTFIAGLLNILAIYDACAGPLLILPRRKEKSRKEKKGEQGSNSGGKKGTPRDGPESGASTTEELLPEGGSR